ncbi:MAG: BON domain-containing protein [Perlucidibaca sp.]
MSKTPAMRRLALVTTLSITLLPLSGCNTLAEWGVGPSISEPGTRTTALRLTDMNLAQAIRRDIYRDIPAARDSRILVYAFYQSVLLLGEAQDQAMKDKIAEIARAYPDVRVVHNELSIGPTRSVSGRLSDEVLENKASFSLFSADELRSSQALVAAVDGTLYLMGKLTQRETDRAIVRLQALDGVRRIVKIVDILPEPAAGNSSQGAQ